MSNSRNIEIEYLRAVAIGLTLLCHLPVLLPFHQDYFNFLFSLYMPWSGVDLFFCISGYVVSRAYVEFFDERREKGDVWLAIQSFWVRRIYRLLPTAWLWILIPLLLSVFFNETGVFGTWYENLRSFTAVAAFSGNLANQYGMTLGPNSVYWSLALEEQFYFIFPIFILLVPSNRWRLALLALCIAAQFPLDRNMFGPNGVLASFRLDAMMWGVLIFMFSRSRIYRQYEPTFLRGAPVKVFLLNILFIYMLGAIPGQMIATPIAVGLIAIVSALLVCLASFNGGYISSLPGLSGFLQWMGSRSYAIYVIHMPAYRASVEIWTRFATAQGVGFNGGLTAELLLTAALLVVVFSEMNYRFIELPLRNYGAEVARRRLSGACYSER